MSEAGWEFRALVRSTEKAVQRGIPPERLVQGDLTGALPELPEGVDTVVHLAGLLHALDPGAMQRVNEGGTQRLIEWCREQAPGARLVHVSSLAAAGPGEGAQSARPPEHCQPVSTYGASKLAAERCVVEGGLPYVVLRPGIVYGPWDTDVLTLFKTCGRGIGLLAGPPVRYSLVHVHDLVRAVMRACEEHGADGSFLPIAHEETLGDAAWMRLIGESMGRKLRVLRLPLFVAAGTAWLGDRWGSLRGKAPVFGWDKYKEMRAGTWICDPAPAREALGFCCELEHLRGHRETAGWYRERGWL
jgi:dihydroflavonol-4-reductase